MHSQLLFNMGLQTTAQEKADAKSTHCMILFV